MGTEAERIVDGWLETNTIAYWLDICTRAVATCDEEERWHKEYELPVPEWVDVRRRQYIDLDEVLCKRLA